MTDTISVVRKAAWVVAWDEAASRHVYMQDADVAFSKAGLTILSLFVCGLSGALAIFSILKVALGGGAY